MEIECPNCHKFFTIEKEGSEIVDDEKAEGLHSTLKDDLKDVEDFAKHPLNMHPMPEETEDEVEDVTTEYKYKCKHCGHEWSEFKTKEKRIQ